MLSNKREEGKSMCDDAEKRRETARWILKIFTVCVLIYLCISHVDSIAGALVWGLRLAEPLFIGIILALIINVPMSFFERWLFRKKPDSKARRPLAILLALLSVLGIFVGVAVLVIPELAEAVRMIIQILSQLFDSMAVMGEQTDYSNIPLGEYLAGIDIDWNGLKNNLEAWFAAQSSRIVDGVMAVLGNVADKVVTLFLSFIFSLYILGGKEKLKRQVCRLLSVWTPKRLSSGVIHICAVCSRTFQNFIAGQATEAVILGVLCMLGMLVLRIPYAPMVGALVGVTALIPVVGAFAGAIIGAIMILTVSPWKALVFLVFLVILQQLEENLIYPRVVGSRINLPAIWVLAAITVGEAWRALWACCLEYRLCLPLTIC